MSMFYQLALLALLFQQNQSQKCGLVQSRVLPSNTEATRPQESPSAPTKPCRLCASKAPMAIHSRGGNRKIQPKAGAGTAVFVTFYITSEQSSQRGVEMSPESPRLKGSEYVCVSVC